MKKVVLTLLVVVVAAGLLAGAGFAGYRIGYSQAALSTKTTIDKDTPYVHGFPFMHPTMPMQNFSRDLDRSFNRGMGMDNFGMRGRVGFGLFSPMMLLGRILFWVLVIWFIYWLFTKSGWHLTRKPQSVENPKVETSTPEEKEA